MLGNRHGQGTVFFKPEGYATQEHPLYRGGFKNGQYHGHGTLYWPGSSLLRYVGRFKNGKRHGRGIEFEPPPDPQRKGSPADGVGGNGGGGVTGAAGMSGAEGVGAMDTGVGADAQRRVYQGSFREDQREGRGEEFADGVRVYKGEFSRGCRHGFGVAYYGEGARYFGRFESNMMCGLGIYCHPGGNRFEGMFFK